MKTKWNISLDTIREACLLCGFFALMAGLWILHPSAALIVGGVLLLVLGYPPKGGE